MIKFKPSSLENFIATLPESYQILALQAIKEEHDRFACEDFTEEEKTLFKFTSDLGTALAKTIDRVAQEAMFENNNILIDMANKLNLSPRELGYTNRYAYERYWSKKDHLGLSDKAFAFVMATRQPEIIRQCANQLTIDGEYNTL